MTTYSAVAAGEIDADSPVTTDLMGKLANNPVAITEGASGAPRIRGEAIATAANGGLPVLTVAAADTYDLGEGMAPVVGTLVTSSSSEVVAQTYTVSLFTGAVRARCTLTAGGGGVATARLYKNGTSLGTSTSSSQSYDVSVVPGDVLQWRHFTNGTGTSTIALVIRASKAYLPQSAFILAT